MEWRHITLFCLILEHQSISRAAQAALLSQPTVSQHLKALEAELGVTLFHRINRKMMPTEAGELFYRYARRAVNLIEHGRRELDVYMGKIRGELRLAGSTIPGQYILPRALAAFKRKHPEVTPQILIGDSRRVVDQVQADEVELGFVGDRFDAPALLFRPFAKDELILVTSPEHPLAKQGSLALDALPGVAFVARERGSGTRSSWESFLVRSGIDPAALTVTARFGSTEALVRAVKARIGVGVVSTRAVEEELRRNGLVRISLEGACLERTFYMVSKKGRTLSPAARAFGRHVLESPPAQTTPVS